MSITKTDKKVSCTSSGSNFYVVGKEYYVYKDHADNKYVKGSDGILDKMSTMVSKFKDC